MQVDVRPRIVDLIALGHGFQRGVGVWNKLYQFRDSYEHIAVCNFYVYLSIIAVLTLFCGTFHPGQLEVSERHQDKMLLVVDGADVNHAGKTRPTNGTSERTGRFVLAVGMTDHSLHAIRDVTGRAKPQAGTTLVVGGIFAIATVAASDL